MRIYLLSVQRSNGRKKKGDNMIFHRINIPTVTNTIGEPGKQDSTQNSSDHIQQKQTDENKELNITLEQAKEIALQKAGIYEQV